MQKINIKKIKIYLIPLTILVLLLVVFFISKSQDIKIKEVKTNDYEMPTYEMPLSLFAEDKIQWGSVNTDRDTDDYRTWTYATVDAGYRSAPTTIIQLSKEEYSNKSEALPEIKNADLIYNEDGSWKELYDEQIEEYGDLAKRFLPEDYITNLEEFDVDGDGSKEKIVSICGVGGNHCPHGIVILKNNKIIFNVSAGLTSLNVESTETGNGFYVQWVPTNSKDPKWDIGLCCPPGYISTRFIFDKNKFVPIYEQENLYIKIKNTQ